ncbi:adenosylcobinamide-GDP ribazoletransferase [Microbaculum marinisediminis]|uniref:Adenosylcobinamide-GDP ribazoletransferase n=1 Tax=Microbaculum marinisediminis TaxID=2931392 RepID=A0AAW5R039_9HYPH|nr:adenosylcobinamide-GDP ribazoletransferase [Microbaculum sp. A6E488]MCT8971885.1 adenosylcobinamide-GDP ribazoletransferase [Microbaculum sp. A6E488]
MSRLSELVSAFGLLTRLPVARIVPGTDHADAGSSVWAYPLVGVVVGLIGGFAYWLLASIGVTPLVAGAVALGAMVLATGGLHEDGLADTADGFGGGATREAKLEIMRDSRIGSYGVIALVLVFALRLGAISALAGTGAVLGALVASAALSRGGMGLFMRLIDPARTDGLSAGVGSPDGSAAAEAAAIAILIAFLVLAPGAAILAIIFAGLAAITVGVLAIRQIGGQTGDVVGAAGIAAECAALTAIVAIAA